MNYPDKPPEYDNPKASVPQVAPLPTSLPQPSNGQLDPFDMRKSYINQPINQYATFHWLSRL